MSEIEFYLDEVRTRLFRDFDVTVCLWLFSNDEYENRPLPRCHAVARKALRNYYEDDPPETYQYVLAPAGVVRERLAMQGYTANRVKRMWEDARTNLLGRTFDFHSEALETERSYFETVTYEEWQRALKAGPVAAFEGGDGAWHVDVCSIFRSDPLWDEFAELALRLDALRPTVAWLDLTNAYFERAFDPALSLRENLDAEEVPRDPALGDFDPIIILTEGKTDQRIISAAMTAMYPEFAAGYQFMDLAFRIEGGASPLARMVKSFAGVRTQSRMLAIFDNDAAGAEALLGLKMIRLPSNLRTISLPDIELARRYPTIGPEGVRRMDVNGAACAIELFLGRRSLIDEQGQLRPVRWSQWNKGADRYQGELEGKDAVQITFLASLDASPAILRRRFPEMCALLQTIFDAFKNEPA